MARALPGGQHQEVTYPASFGTIANVGPSLGATDAMRRATAMSTRCPGTPLALAGYSQGGMAMTVFINRRVPLPVASVVLWASPFHRQTTEMDMGTGRRGRGIFAGISSVPQQYRAVTREWCNSTTLSLTIG